MSAVRLVLAVGVIALVADGPLASARLAEVAACKGASLRAALVGGVAQQQVVGVLKLNTSGAPCSLHGRPRLEILDPDNHSTGVGQFVSALPNGPWFAPLRILEPGSTAAIPFYWRNECERWPSGADGFKGFIAELTLADGSTISARSLSDQTYIPVCQDPSVPPTLEVGPYGDEAVSLGTMGCHIRGRLPDPTCTPGFIDKHATARTLCRAHRRERASLLARDTAYGEYGIALPPPSGYVIDWLVPARLGGLVGFSSNLWPQRSADARRKDAVERALFDRVCAGALRLVDAQRMLKANWLSVYRRIIG